jgi:lipopolysaccharide/colanic/teichoic acid biosynthesis glycosyltransferase
MPLSILLLKTLALLPLLSTPQVPTLFSQCSLTWEDTSLLVNPRASQHEASMPALQNPAWLRECLLKSPIQRIYLDATLSDSILKDWADMAWATGKQVYLHLPQATHLPQTMAPVAWRFKRLADWVAAAVVLTVLSPLLVLIAVAIRLDSPGPILFRQWRVGHQGRLFRICKFRSMAVDAEARHHEVMGEQEGLHKLERDPRITRLGYWLRKLSLDELPQLWNVLRGEMSLVGPRPWALYDAVRIAPPLRQRLNSLPGITGPWQVSMRANELDLYAVTCRDLAYLQCWTLVKDVRILLLTVPKALLGSGAY